MDSIKLDLDKFFKEYDGVFNQIENYEEIKEVLAIKDSEGDYPYSIYVVFENGTKSSFADSELSREGLIELIGKEHEQFKCIKDLCKELYEDTDNTTEFLIDMKTKLIDLTTDKDILDNINSVWNQDMNEKDTVGLGSSEDIFNGFLNILNQIFEDSSDKDEIIISFKNFITLNT